MQCFVYASKRKSDTYLWLAEREGVARVPASLALMLGELRFVMEVQLHAQRKLPLEDAEVVRADLRTHGWHLQLPPSETLVTGSRQDERQSRSPSTRT
ncbi:MAG: YcgL domain-containing protein [Rhodanobacter sp.]